MTQEEYMNNNKIDEERNQHWHKKGNEYIHSTLKDGFYINGNKVSIKKYYLKLKDAKLVK